MIHRNLAGLKAEKENRIMQEMVRIKQNNAEGSLQMKEQIKKFLENYKKEVMDTVDELRDRPMREETEELFALFETTGNRKEKKQQITDEF